MKLRHLIHGRVDPGIHRRLQQEAAARRISMTACVGDLLREYFALQDEMGGGGTAEGQAGAWHRGMIHSFLARSEERLAATLEQRTSELGDWLQKLEVMLDRLVVIYLVHTLEVPPELQNAAVASATQRYRSYWKYVREELAKGRRGGGGRGGSQGPGETSGRGPGSGPAGSEPAPDASGAPGGRPAPS
jgi:hypothetical protein